MTNKDQEKKLVDGKKYDIKCYDGDEWQSMTWVAQWRCFEGVWLLPNRYGPDCEVRRKVMIEDVLYAHESK